MRNLLIFAFCTIALSGFSQNRFKQWTVTPGVSYSVFRGIHTLPFKEYETDFKFTVGGQINVDLALFRFFSVGGGFIHHRHQLNIYNYTYFLNGQTVTENPIQLIDVTAFYFRGLVHVNSIYKESDEQLDVYWGLQQHFIQYNTRNTSKDPSFYELDESIQKIPGLVAGIRYFPSENFGMHAEIALIGAYNISLGMAFRTQPKRKFFNLFGR